MIDNLNKLLTKIARLKGYRSQHIWKEFYAVTSFVKLGQTPDSNLWPNSWKTPLLKQYPNALKINLLTPVKNSEFTRLLTKRRSQRDFNNYPLGFDELSELLFHSAGLTIKKKFRNYPSPGGLYSLEIYPIILNSDEIPIGIYPYNVAKHILELIKNRRFQR